MVIFALVAGERSQGYQVINLYSEYKGASNAFMEKVEKLKAAWPGHAGVMENDYFSIACDYTEIIPFVVQE